MNVHAVDNRVTQDTELHPPRLQRSRGRAELTFKKRDTQTVLDHLHQEGCCKIRFPHEANVAQAILINTSGGLTDHDIMDVHVHWREGTTAIVTSQAAEKIYKSRGAPSHILNHLDVDKGATAFWVPQETILFDQGQVCRHLTAHIAKEGRLLAHESIMFGRSAMGETVQSGSMIDKWRLYYDGKLLFADTLSLKGDLQKQLLSPALFAGSIASASFVYIGEDAEEVKACIQALTDDVRSHCGVSMQGSLMVIRLLAKNAQSLRHDITHVLSSLLVTISPGSAGNKQTMLPRVWSC